MTRYYSYSAILDEKTLSDGSSVYDLRLKYSIAHPDDDGNVLAFPLAAMDYEEACRHAERIVNVIEITTGDLFTRNF